MSTDTLKLLSVQLFPGSQYEPRHTRAVYFDTDAGEYLARATIGTDVIVEVVGSNNIAAEMTLSTRLVEIFRALRAAA